VTAPGADAGPRSPAPVEAICDGLIEAGWLIALAVTPLFFNPYSWVSFEPDKVAVLQCIVVLMAAAWLVKVVTGGRAWRPAGTGSAEPGRRASALASLARFPLAVPVVLVVASTVVAWLLSIDPGLSWRGSYHRAQGVSTEVAYLAIFMLALGHLRTHDQWRRASYAIILPTVPIALYGVLQHLGSDPVSWGAERRRVVSTFGNPIFLAAYLALVLLVTGCELTVRAARLLARRPAATEGASRSPWPHALGVAVLLAILALQAYVMVLSASRGPVLGLLTGGCAALLAGLLLARRAPAGVRPWMRAVLSRAWLVVLVAGLAGVALLTAANLPSSPVAGLREQPYLGRLATAFNLESRTARVRQLIWQGSLNLLRSREPLRAPDGTLDRRHRWRPLVGYGPETFALAFGRVQTPELAQTERRGEIPDRAHNDTFQLLVTHGALGWLAWASLHCSILYYSLSWLGLLGSSGRRIEFWAASAGGALVGAVAPVALTGSAVLSGAGVSIGLVLGVVAFATAAALRGGQSPPLGFRELLILTILAAVVAHCVELAVGIAITSTRLLLWFLAAVLVVAGTSWSPGPQPRNPQLAGGGGSARKGRDRRPRPAAAAAWRHGAAVGLIAAAVLATASFALITNPGGATRTGSVVSAALLGAASGGPSGLMWLLLVTWLAAALLAPWGDDAEAAVPRWPGIATFVAASAVPWLAVVVVQSSRLAGDHRLLSPASGPLPVIDHVSRHVDAFVLALLVLAACLGAVLARREGTAPARFRRPLVGVLLLAVASTLVLVAAAMLLRPSRADTFLKHGNAVVSGGRPRPAIELVERAAALDPREPNHQAALGTTAVAAAQRAADPADRARCFAVAEAAFERARALAPLDPDHTQNLARLWSVQARWAADAGRRTALLEKSEREYAAAVAMRPHSRSLLLEQAAVRLEAERVQRQVHSSQTGSGG